MGKVADVQDLQERDASGTAVLGQEATYVANSASDAIQERFQGGFWLWRGQGRALEGGWVFL